MKLDRSFRDLRQIPLRTTLLDDAAVAARLRAGTTPSVPVGRRYPWLSWSVLGAATAAAVIVWLQGTDGTDPVSGGPKVDAAASASSVVPGDGTTKPPAGAPMEAIATLPPQRRQRPTAHGHTPRRTAADGTRSTDCRLRPALSMAHRSATDTPSMRITEDFIRQRAVAVRMADAERLNICVDDANGILRIPYNRNGRRECTKSVLVVGRSEDVRTTEACAAMGPDRTAPVFAIVSHYRRVDGMMLPTGVQHVPLDNTDEWVRDTEAVSYVGSSALVPVQIDIPAERGDAEGRSARVMLFYRATEAIVTSLPANAAGIVSAELAAKRRLESGESVDAACGFLADRPILGVCRTASHALRDVRVVAVPGRAVICHYNLLRSADVSIAIHDLAGNLVAHEGVERHDAGAVDHVLAANLDTGLYRVVINAGGDDVTVNSMVVTR